MSNEVSWILRIIAYLPLLIFLGFGIIAAFNTSMPELRRFPTLEQQHQWHVEQCIDRLVDEQGKRLEARALCERTVQLKKGQFDATGD